MSDFTHHRYSGLYWVSDPDARHPLDIALASVTEDGLVTALA